MTKKNGIMTREELKQVLMEDKDFLKPLMQLLLQEVLEAERDETVGFSRRAVLHAIAARS